MGPLEKIFPTEFQKECIAGLVDVLASSRSGQVTAEALGASESYIKVSIVLPDSSQIVAWIYGDECMLAVGSRSYHFEKPDFASLEELRMSFLDLVASLLQGKESTPRCSHWFGLFRGRDL